MLRYINFFHVPGSFIPYFFALLWPSIFYAWAIGITSLIVVSKNFFNFFTLSHHFVSSCWLFLGKAFFRSVSLSLALSFIFLFSNVPFLFVYPDPSLTGRVCVFLSISKYKFLSLYQCFTFFLFLTISTSFHFLSWIPGGQFSILSLSLFLPYFSLFLFPSYSVVLTLAAFLGPGEIF